MHAQRRASIGCPERSSARAPCDLGFEAVATEELVYGRQIPSRLNRVQALQNCKRSRISSERLNGVDTLKPLILQAPKVSRNVTGDVLKLFPD